LRREHLRRKDVEELIRVSAVGNALARRDGRPSQDIGGHSGYGGTSADLNFSLLTLPRELEIDQVAAAIAEDLHPGHL